MTSVDSDAQYTYKQIWFCSSLIQFCPLRLSFPRFLRFGRVGEIQNWMGQRRKLMIGPTRTRTKYPLMPRRI
jgi:hypothetical protein